MEDYFDQDKTKAFVYLLSEGDDKNKAMISDDKLLVIRQSHKQSWDLNNIYILKPENKKLLFPLILGGIFTPFAFLSYFVNLFHPWFHLLSIMCGLYLFYYGWMGKSALTIIFKNGEELHYYLSSISKNLHAFIDYVNTLQNKTNDVALRDMLFFELEKKYESTLFSGPKISDHEIFPLFGYTYNQLKMGGKSIYGDNLFIINPIKSGIEIKIAFDPETSQMRPKLEGPVLESSKVNIPYSK